MGERLSVTVAQAFVVIPALGWRIRVILHTQQVEANVGYVRAYFKRHNNKLYSQVRWHMSVISVLRGRGRNDSKDSLGHRVNPYKNKKTPRASEMTHWLKVLTNKSGDLSSTPRTHTVEGMKQLPKVVL